jgi:hypothetical protein
MGPVLVAVACCSLTITALDESRRPVAGASVRAGEARAVTDAAGGARLSLPGTGDYTVEVSAPGLQTMRKEFRIEADDVTIEILLPRDVHESITVEAEAEATGTELKQVPADPPTLRDALPLIPGVARTPEGRLTISSSPEYRSTLLLNSQDVTDPATGSFGATVPIDSVASLDVFKSPFLAEYGRFSQAVVVVDTRRGGDKWHAGLNDPTPEFRLRSGHVRGVRGFTPRLSFSGPLVAGKLYFSQSGEYRLNKAPAFTQPFPQNEIWREGWNSLTQLDWTPSARHSWTVTVHAAPQKVKFAGLDFYTPRPSTANQRSREFHAGVREIAMWRGGVLESAVSAGEIVAGTWPQAGAAEMVLQPATTAGTYFSTQERRARRYHWVESYTHPRGRHTLKFGGSFVRSEARGWWRSHPVIAAGMDGAALTRIDFLNQPGYGLRDHEIAVYGEDHIQLRPAVTLDVGVRVDRQQVARLLRAAPRAAVSWSPFGESGIILRAGAGLFYDRLPLVVAGFPRWPARVEDGEVRVPELGTRNWAPRSRNWSAQVEQRFARRIRLRAGYLESRSEGLPVLDSETRLVLSDGGRARYRQLEVVSRFGLRAGGELFVSYVRSSGNSNVNEFLQFLGDLPMPIVRPDFYTTSAADMPHRVLLWGVVPLNQRTRIAPAVEYRTGLPWSPVDASQQYAGAPNSRRFPPFLSVDFKVSRDIHVKKHGVQISFSMFNVTNHWNPDSVRRNVADPQFGEFLGQHRRRFRLDFDYLF